MAKKDWLVLIGISLFTLLSVPAKAQQRKAEVKGTVVERTSNVPLEAANVWLLAESDSVMLDVVSTSDDGVFLFSDVSIGSYLIKVSYVGFKPEFYPFEITARTLNMDVGVVEMEESIIYLDEVVVTAKISDLRRYWRHIRQFGRNG